VISLPSTLRRIIYIAALFLSTNATGQAKDLTLDEIAARITKQEAVMFLPLSKQNLVDSMFTSKATNVSRRYLIVEAFSKIPVGADGKYPEEKFVDFYNDYLRRKSAAATVKPQSSALGEYVPVVSVTEQKTGGIDLKHIQVATDKTSSALSIAPFDVSRFTGFSFSVDAIRDADMPAVLAMVK
jgi:hypothetical protein